MAAANFYGRQACTGLLLVFALTGCLRHEAPVTGSIKDDPAPAKSAAPAKPKQPVKKTAAAAAKVATKQSDDTKGPSKDPGKAAAVQAPAPATAPAKAAVAAPAPAGSTPAAAAPAPAAPAAAAPKSAAAPASPPPAASAPAPAAKAAAAPASAPSDPRAKAVQAIADGRKLMEEGKVLEARKRFSASMDAAAGDANWALAQSYDPHYLQKLKASDGSADLGRALQLYTTAMQAGTKDAEPDLARLRVSLGLSPK